ncbi:phosphatidylethanolamine-binding protein [Corynascus novoguineensis]|uniref:Phosphatidylethanolamine-binding protein n=1 Tax=Corynascus novoguineensis TaxID=1126955 RepID=A0AAN7CZU1_9PEZI|nr:phosphatidylethanolamine-binding protein [Corynascus novoguineensis]
MAFRCLAALVAATTVLAKTPAGFTPSSETDLIVEFNGFVPLNGVDISKSVTTSQPRIGTLSRLNGTSYAVMMVDLDIPTNAPPETDTLLHWMQIGLVPSPTPTQLNTTSGPIRVFLLETPPSSPIDGTIGGAELKAEAIVPYFGPNPPARVPLSHRYTQILVDTSALTETGTAALRRAAETSMRGFNTSAALAAAGLDEARAVVAGNSFNVTNPGPAAANNATGGSGGSGGESQGGSEAGTETGTGEGARQTVLPGEAVGLRPGSVMLGGLVSVAVVALGL